MPIGSAPTRTLVTAWHLGSLVAILIGLIACDRAEPASAPPAAPSPPSAHARSIDRTSEAALYHVSIRRDPAAGRYSAVHEWLVRVEDADGQIVRPTRLAFSGGMPQHRHGFQTAPYVIEALDEGWFRIGGVRFHMPGTWTLRVELVGPAGPDVALFEISVPP